MSKSDDVRGAAAGDSLGGLGSVDHEVGGSRPDHKLASAPAWDAGEGGKPWP